MLCAPYSVAQPAGDAPHQMIRQTTDRLLVLIEQAKDYFDNEPERYFSELSTIVEPMIDFNSFTRSVMGTYGTRDYYRSLDKPSRAAFKKDYKRFVGVFKQGLMQTYGKGLLAFNGEKILIEPATTDDLTAVQQGQVVSVVQTIKGNDTQYTITYKMRPNKKGEWKLRNVTIDSINVGKLYQNQFAAAMKKFEGSFAKVTDNWIEESAEARETVGSGQ